MTAAEKRAATGIASFLSRFQGPAPINRSRLFIHTDGSVTIENLSPVLLTVALKLDPNNRRLQIISETIQ